MSNHVYKIVEIHILVHMLIYILISTCHFETTFLTSSLFTLQHGIVISHPASPMVDIPRRVNFLVVRHNWPSFHPNCS